jgi:hypothetical protein
VGATSKIIHGLEDLGIEDIKHEYIDAEVEPRCCHTSLIQIKFV